ncbi:MAG: hypothetical protein AAB420_02910 [Patescibacteria group bacterium]
MEGKTLTSFLFILGSTIVLLFAVDLALATVMLLFKVSVSSWEIFVSAGIALAIGFFLLRKYVKRFFVAFLLLLVILVILTAGSLKTAQTFVDLSYDGQAYHQTAIIMLAQGWNPLYEQVSADELKTLARWINHYPKASWIYGASLYKVFGDIESGKLYGLLFAAAAFFILLSLLLEMRYRWWVASFVAMLVVFNPVTISESMSYYVDGPLFSLLVILCSLLGLFYIRKDKTILLTVGATLVILLNIKFTAVIYAAIAIVLMLFLMGINDHVKLVKQLALASLLSFFVGICLIGFNPYITNTFRDGNPFFPLAGKHAIDLKPYNVPQNFLHKNSAIILFYSIFSRSDSVRGPNTFAHLKLPFSVQKSEWQQFTDTSTKEGGFGPLFGGALLVSLILIIPAFRRLKNYFSGSGRNKEEETHKDFEHMSYVVTALVITVGIIISAAINPISSVARYVPQVWLIPFVLVLLGLRFKSKASAIVCSLVLLTLFINSAVITKTYITTNYANAKKTRMQLDALKTSSQAKPIALYFGEFKIPTQLKLDSYGIRYQTIDDPDSCITKKRILVANITQQCN